MQKGDVMGEMNLMDFWTKELNEKSRTGKLEFYGREANPSLSIVPLYTNLKTDEISKTGYVISE